jgi:hypothetical protein
MEAMKTGNVLHWIKKFPPLGPSTANAVLLNLDCSIVES